MFNLYMFTSLSFFIISLFFLFISLICLKFNIFYMLKFSLNNILYLNINYFILIDWISASFMFVVLFISSMVIFYSYSYMLNDKKNMKFLILMILFVLSMNFLVISPNLLISILGWDGLGLISFCLIIFYNNENSNYCGILTIMTNRLGDIGLLLSIIMMMNFSSWDMMFFSLEKTHIYFIIFFLMLAAMTKSAQLPFSAWLPAAMAAPTPVSSLVHSSTLVTAGIYLIIRMYIFFSNNFFSELLLISSILTMFLAGVSAMFETDMKKIIALSTLSQLGVMMMILSTKNFELALFHLLTHAMFKACLFLCAGAIIHSSLNWQDIRHISLMSKLSPSISSSLIITNFSLMGFPFLSGFYSKDLILEFMYLSNNSFIFLLLIILSTMLTSLYSLRLLYFIFNKNNMMIMSNFHDNKFINLPIILMSSSVIFFGNIINWIMFPNPMFFYFNWLNKMTNLIIISLSIYLFYIFFYLNKNMFIFKHFHMFFGKMWFSENTSLILTIFLKNSKFLFKNMESWIELSSSKLIMNELFLLNMKLNMFLISKLNFFLKIMMLIMLIYFLNFIKIF
uniref:NADH-ubiquinone oxidoreductase chain 5 n=1 Tax=Echinolaelaps traubi TaxID=3119979 RepID=A0AAU6PB48_9ACAR